MMSFKSAAGVVRLASIATIILAMTAGNPIFADDGPIYNPGVLVHDNFQSFYYKPDAQAYWYTENRGYLNGQEVNSRETPCAMQTCVQLIQAQGEDDSQNFMRLEVHAHNYAGFFTLANLSELQDGLGGTGNPSGSWTPTVGHPITVTAKLKFAPNMKPDGSGGAVGSAGLVLWNNPYSPSLNSQGPGQNLLGYGWSYNGADLKGFYAVVAQQTTPIFIDPVLTVNMQQWNTYKFVWSVDALGLQTISYYVNNLFIGTAPVPNFTNMSLEAWVDNQQLTFTGINDVAVPQGDYMDIGSVRISKD